MSCEHKMFSVSWSFLRVCVQEIHGLWNEVEAEVKLKKTSITELNLKLTETEKQRADQVRLSFTFKNVTQRKLTT